MQIVKALPPNIDEIDLAFGVRDKLAAGMSIYFCYGGAIYNPRGTLIAPQIMAHERVHVAQQRAERAALQSINAGAEAWWEKYIADPAFRLHQEVHAHAAEFVFAVDHDRRPRPPKGFRSTKDWHLIEIATRLCSPLYGNIIKLSEAKRLILEQAAFIH